MNTQPCNCEHASHANADNGEFRGMPNPSFPYIRMDSHFYLSVPAGKKNAAWVGPICDDCANSHMKKYIV